MDIRILITLGVLLLPVFISFGWLGVKRRIRKAREQHMVTFDGDTDFIVDDMLDDDALTDDFNQQRKPHYVDEYYC